VAAPTSAAVTIHKAQERQKLTADKAMAAAVEEYHPKIDDATGMILSSRGQDGAAAAAGTRADTPQGSSGMSQPSPAAAGARSLEAGTAAGVAGGDALVSHDSQHPADAHGSHGHEHDHDHDHHHGGVHLVLENPNGDADPSLRCLDAYSPLRCFLFALLKSNGFRFVQLSFTIIRHVPRVPGYSQFACS
jgi:hypothetical protein